MRYAILVGYAAAETLMGGATAASAQSAGTPPDQDVVCITLGVGSTKAGKGRSFGVGPMVLGSDGRPLNGHGEHGFCGEVVEQGGGGKPMTARITEKTADVPAGSNDRGICTANRPLSSLNVGDLVSFVPGECIASRQRVPAGTVLLKLTR